MTARRPRIPELHLQVYTIPHMIPWGVLYHYYLPLIPPDVLSPRPKLARLADSLRPPRATPYWLRQWLHVIKPGFWVYLWDDDREDRRAIGDYYAYLARIKSRQSSDREAEHELEVLESRVLERWLRILVLDCASPTPRTTVDEKFDERPEEELVPSSKAWVWPSSTNLLISERHAVLSLSDASDVATKYAMPACSTEVSDAAFEQVFGLPSAPIPSLGLTDSSRTPSRPSAESTCESIAKFESIGSTSPPISSSTPPSSPRSISSQLSPRRMYPPALGPPPHRPDRAVSAIDPPAPPGNSVGNWLASLGHLSGVEGAA